MKKILFACLIFFLGNSFIKAQTLIAGDIAFIGWNTDSPDAFAFITLTDIPGSEVIYFTDRGTAGTVWGPAIEDMAYFTAPAGGISCGTVVTITDAFGVGSGVTIAGITGASWTWFSQPGQSSAPNNFNLSAGDQMLAFQKTAYNPLTDTPADVTFIAGVHGDDGATNCLDPVTGWSQTFCVTATTESDLPLGLTNGVNCVSLFPASGTEQDNVKYNGTLTGTSTILRGLINDRTNWISNNSTPIDISPTAYSPSVTCVAACSEPTVPSVTETVNPICTGSSTTLNWAGSNLNDATKWHIYTGGCGTTQLTSQTGTSLVVTPTVTTTYNIRGEGGCTTPATCGSITITVNALDNASFSYGASAYCADATDPTPTITGLGGGTFTYTPAGLSISAGTGAIDVSASSQSTYTVTYTTAGTCPNSSGTSVTVNALDNASFTYDSAAYCADGSDPTPTITGLPGGTFSSTAGLTINSGTGEIDVSTTTPGTYTVTYTTAGTCPNSSGASVTVNALDDESFNYAAASYCADGSDPTPTITGLAGGTFSSTAGLTINASTGAIDVSTSTPATYTVTYTTTGSCPNSSDVSVTIDAIANQTVIPATATICSGSGTTIDLGSSEIGVSYTLRDDADDSIIAGPITGTGNSISFNTGNITNTTTYNVFAGAPVSSTTLDFGGNGSGDFIDMGTGINSVFTGTNKITVETWVKRTSTGSLQTIASNYVSNMQFLLRIDNDNIVFWVSNGSFTSANGGTTLPVDTWMHISGTWDGATIKVYYNGVLDGSTAYTGNMPAVANTFRIGGGFGSEYFPGSIADVSIWNIAKTQAEIAVDQTACITGVETGIIALYKMGDGTGSSSLTDLTGNGYDGTLNAMDVNTVWNSSFTPSCTTCSLEMTQTATVTVNALDDASFNYSAATYCADGSDPTPTITGLAGGSFSSTAGLTLNAGTGAIDVSTTTPGTYTVTYTTAGTCPNSSGASVTVNALDDASFNYSTAAYTVDDSDPTPTITGLTGGTFSSTAGLSINASTGAIDVSASTVASYTVTYTTAGICPNSSNVSVEITASNLGLENNLFVKETSLYPNPNKGAFTLSYSGSEQLKNLYVTDILGKRVQTVSLENFTNSKEINLTELAKGMYLITIQSASARITKRIIIE